MIRPVWHKMKKENCNRKGHTTSAFTALVLTFSPTSEKSWWRKPSLPSDVERETANSVSNSTSLGANLARFWSKHSH